jgi:hypothetical protein
VGLSIRAQRALDEQMRQQAAREREARAAAAVLADQFEISGMPTRIVCLTLGISRRTLHRWMDRGVITPLGDSTSGVTHRFALADVMRLRGRMMSGKTTS